MAVPQIVLPIIAGVALVAIIASIFATCHSSTYDHRSNHNRNYSPQTWPDIRNENESRRRKKPKKKCPVCLESIEELAEQDCIIYSLKCGHLMCADCITKIQNFHRTSGDSINPRCPECRIPFARNELRKIVW